jgi:glycosyltransferase involved in cell wall biosynthesis
MAAARAVVSTDVGGAAEAIVEGQTGFLVRPGDAEAMADRIISLLRDDGRREAMGRRGRQIALETFSLQKQLEKTEALYERLMNARRVKTGTARDDAPYSPADGCDAHTRATYQQMPR